MKTYELLPTKHPDLFRVVDANGNWTHYHHRPSNRYLRGITTILDQGYAKGPFFEEWLAKHTAAERDEILRTKGERGDKVHRAIDFMLTNGGKLNRYGKIFTRESGQEEPIAPDEWDCLLAFASFWRAHEPVLYISEAPMFSLRHGYAGTADAILKLTKECAVKTCRCKDLIGKIGLWDWKTSSGIRASYSAQGAAYATADNVRDYLPKRSKIAYIGVLRVGTNHKTTGGYELKSFDVKESFKRFQSAQMLANYEYEPFTTDDIRDIPEDITLSVDAYVEPTKRAKKITSERKRITKEKSSQ